MRRGSKASARNEYAPLPTYAADQARPPEQVGSIEIAAGKTFGPACMWMLAMQIMLLFAQAFLLRGNVHVKSQHMRHWHEPSQISRDAHESLVIAVVVREGSDGQPEIWTRRRPEHADGRNRMYAGRWEALAKPLRHGESPPVAIQGPFRDLFNMNDHSDFRNVRIMGTLDEDMNSVLTTLPDDFACMDRNLSNVARQNCVRENMKRQDRYFVLHNPYVYVQALQGTTPWTAIGMVTVLQDHTKHNPSVDGLEMRWWKADELVRALTKTPKLFTGVHFPVLLKAASDLQAGRIKVSEAGQYRTLFFSAKRQDGYFSDVLQNETLYDA